jgi:hypothetical protein
MFSLYKLEKSFLPKDMCFSMARKMEDLLQKGIYRNPDTQCRLSPAWYGIFNDELELFRPAVEKIVGCELLPVYTYGRIYQENDYLLPHFDRKGAEISLTITLDYEKFIWPIYLQGEQDFLEFLLDVGDALVYEGSKISHLRHPMSGQSFQHQTFFHYVKKDGEFNFLKFDERPKLLSNKEAEPWNHPDWSDDLFQQGEVGPINNNTETE